MDWISIGNLAVSGIKKYRYVLIILIAGILLMLFPENTSHEQLDSVNDMQQEMPLQDSLAEILSLIEGAGKARVLLTQAQGERFFYQTDEDISTTDNSSDIRRETVILSDSSRGEYGLVQQTIPPVFQGAVILCQGADNPKVRLSIVEAVSNATGLTSNNITVLKMK